MKPIIALALGLATSALALEPLPKLIGHRGASFDAPENTLASFKLAFEQAADGVETDVYLTSDGKIVCIHDKSTKRTSGGIDMDVTQSSYAELAKLDIGSWKNPKYKGEKISTLEEVLAIIPPGKFFFIEIKDTPRIVEPILKVLESQKADPAHIVLISFSADVISACREKIPAYRAYLITSMKDFEKPGRPEAEIAALDACHGQGLLFKSSAPVTPDWIKLARGPENRTMFCWNVDELELGKRMIALGVDFMGTNKPGFLRGELTK